MIKSDRWIHEMVERHRMIEPFEPAQVRRTSSGDRVISYGVSSYGYDLRLADEFLVFAPDYSEAGVIDPKRFNQKLLREHRGDFCVIPPNSYVLGRSLEYFRIPPNVLVICLGKSTYARAGIIVNTTPGEPGWEGHWTIEISNASPLPAKVYAFEGIAQCLFFEGDELPMTNYADRAGKYQGQRGITLPKV